MASSKLILGTVQFGLDYGINNLNGKPSIEAVYKILECARKNKVLILDTAEAYGDSQERIGMYHEKYTHVFKVITKFSPLRIDLPSDIIDRVKLNLKTLNTEFLYSYMFHSYKDYEKYYPFYKDQILELVGQGLIRKIGVSLHSNDEIEQVLENKNIELIQLPFNLLDNDSLRGEVLKKAKNKGVEVHTRSVFLQGLFFKSMDKLEGHVKVLKPYLNQLNEILDSGVKTTELALNYVCEKEYIDNVLIGVDSEIQLKSNIVDLINKPLDEVLNLVDNVNVKEKEMLNPANWNS